MKIEGSCSIEADRQTVWDAWRSPDILSGCIPGCEEFEPTGEDTYRVVLKVRVGVLTGTCTGRVSVTDFAYPDSFRMVVEGKGAGGTVKAEGVLSFAEKDGATEVKLVGDARVGGVVAGLGHRLMDSMSEMLMDQFLNCMKARIEAR